MSKNYSKNSLTSRKDPAELQEHLDNSDKLSQYHRHMIVAIYRFYERATETESVDSETLLQQFIGPFLPDVNKGKYLFSQPKQSESSFTNSKLVISELRLSEAETVVQFEQPRLPEISAQDRQLCEDILSG